MLREIIKYRPAGDLKTYTHTKCRVMKSEKCYEVEY